MSIFKLIAHKTLSIEIQDGRQDGRHEGHQNEAKVIYYGMGTLKFLFSASWGLRKCKLKKYIIGCMGTLLSDSTISILVLSWMVSSRRKHGSQFLNHSKDIWEESRI